MKSFAMSKVFKKISFITLFLCCALGSPFAENSQAGENPKLLKFETQLDNVRWLTEDVLAPNFGKNLGLDCFRSLGGLSLQLTELFQNFRMIQQDQNLIKDFPAQISRMGAVLNSWKLEVLYPQWLRSYCSKEVVGIPVAESVTTQEVIITLATEVRETVLVVLNIINNEMYEQPVPFFPGSSD